MKGKCNCALNKFEIIEPNKTKFNKWLWWPFWRVRRICEKRLWVLSCLSVLPSDRPPAWNTSATTGRIFITCDICLFFGICFEKFHLNLTRIHVETKIHFLSHLAHFFLEWEISQTKVVEKIKTYILWSIALFFFKKIVPFMRWRYGPCALHDGYLRLQTHS